MKIKNQMMKNVKILGALLLLQLCFSACNKNSEENEIQDQDSIIGEWYVFSVDGIELTSCEQEGTITYKEDLSYSVTTYQLLDRSCVSDGEINFGKWKNVGNGVYEIRAGVNDMEKVRIEKLTFSNDYNSFTSERENGYTYLAKRR